MLYIERVACSFGQTQAQHKTIIPRADRQDRESKFRSDQRTMKSSTLVAVLLLQTVMVMGILAHSQHDFPKCCDHCNSWSGAQFCDDVGPKCRDGCVNCRVVQTRPVKTFRCGDGRSAFPYIPCPPPCKKN
ncbi:LOW QUALITY PROTEIN: hypothetical protein CFC21_080384 [Triticum aestivum]|uniref:Bowman-Birk serine protease inhibitors family domain-containing protein n=2 Tax=Triticum aestivum TaxID=4565 RepID=A0A9R1I265_WHEAT|nr:LOW QUALITY PROTEIN: hypothetical protein CFC21_080384 [Triticum aestivum]